MKTRSIQALFFAAALGALFPSGAAFAQSAGYQQPVFHGGAAPVYPASPLAGGMPAAQGGAFMDAHGNPIVMPASYCQDCYGGGGGGDQYGYEGCGYGDAGCQSCGADPMGGAGYADFGGAGMGMEQCGPHYFDVAVDAVFLSESELFAGSGPFASVGAGANAPRVLDPSQSGDEYSAGWQIAGRYDIGPLSVLEGTYMGLYDIGFTDTVRSVDVTNPSQDFQLFSAFSNFGVPTPLAGIDDGSRYTLGYDAQLESAEISFRRYWVGHTPRFSGTWLMGFRYLRLDETLTFQTTSLVNLVSLVNSTRSWGSENDLLGFQLGGDGWVCLRQGLRLGVEGKAGIYNNSYKFRHAGSFPAAIVGAPANFDVSSRNDQAAFAGESGVTLVADILPSLSIRGGYRLLYLNSLASAGGSVDTTNIAAVNVANQADALFHGFTAGMEYVW